MPLLHFLPPFFPPLPFFFEGVLADNVPASSFGGALPDAIAPAPGPAAVDAAASFAASVADAFADNGAGTAPLLAFPLGGMALENWRSCILLVKLTVSCSKRFRMTLERLLNLRHCENVQSVRSVS
jgi:hypothetical protein